MTGVPAGSGRGADPISRRSFLRGLTAAAGLTIGGAALSACSTPVVSGLSATRAVPGTLAYWNLFGGGDGVRMQTMEDGFRKANPDVPLQAVTLAWGNPYYTKLSLATLGDKPPDVAVSHLTRMKTLQARRPAAGAAPGRPGPARDDRRTSSTRRAWKAGLVDGKVYAIPLDTHPFVLLLQHRRLQEGRPARQPTASSSRSRARTRSSTR